jgi:hypothetical protein
MVKDKFKIDRKAFSVVSVEEQEKEERTYWWNKTPYERLEALETTRQIIYGYDPAAQDFSEFLKLLSVH